jgi:hypothetical protein
LAGFYMSYSIFTNQKQWINTKIFIVRAVASFPRTPWILTSISGLYKGLNKVKKSYHLRINWIQRTRQTNKENLRELNI